ncbi:MAG: DUF4397 domain-containing protein [Bacteroidota bacterium]
MKTLKNTIEFKYLFLFMILGIAALTSCTKNDDEATANVSAYVMLTNSAEGSSAQDFYLDNTKLNTTAMAYTQSSGYLATSSGNHTAMFTNSGSTTANASLSLSVQGGQYYSVYFTGGSTASSNSYVTTQDDLTAPASGKAKVRFIQLSSALTTSVDFGISATNKLVSGLAYKAASAYYAVDANTTFFLYASGSTTASLNIPVVIQAGKIYTIYVSGTTTATLTYHIVAQN